MTSELQPVCYDIIQGLCDGKLPKLIQTELGLTPSIFESRFQSIREAAGLPHEKRAYVACADLVGENLRKLGQFRQEEALATARYTESLNKFSF